MSTLITQVLSALSISLYLFFAFLRFGNKKLYFILCSICFFSGYLVLWEMFLGIDLMRELRIPYTAFLGSILVAYKTYFTKEVKYKSVFWVSYFLTCILSLLASYQLGSPAPLLMPFLLTIYTYYYKVAAGKNKRDE